MSKNILITPKPAGNPTIQFSGSTSSIMYIEVQSDGSLIFKGNNANDLVKIEKE